MKHGFSGGKKICKNHQKSAPKNYTSSAKRKKPYNAGFRHRQRTRNSDKGSSHVVEIMPQCEDESQ